MGSVENAASTLHRGFPLSALFVLVALAAICLGLVAGAVRDRREPTVIGLVAGGACMVIGLVTGIAAGVRSVRPARGCFLGMLAGWLSGAFAAVVLNLGLDFRVAASGSLLLAGMGLAARHNFRLRRRAQRRPGGH